MKYRIQSTEKNTGLGADQETRALLYLLNDREDSNQLHWFVIDFFNDVTGINNSCTYNILNIFKELPNQIIFTATLKYEEENHYLPF